MFPIYDCETCRLRRKGELYIVGRWMQILYEVLVQHENGAVGRYIFDKFPDVVLVPATEEGAYTVEGYEINVPFVIGGPLQRLFKVHDRITAAIWKSQSQACLPCIICNFEDDCLAFRNMPSTFLLKQHHYYCPTLIVIDNRRPHRTGKGKVQFSYNSTIYTEDDIPALSAYDCRLNSLGNMAFYPVGSLFPKMLYRLFLNSMHSTTSVRRRLKDLQTCINLGLVERAVLPQDRRYKTGPGYGTQTRVKEVQNRGFSSTTKRYKDLVPNDFQCLTAPFECFKIVTRVANQNEFRTLDRTEFGFLDPCFTSDGKNVGKVVSLSVGTIVSFRKVSGALLIKHFEEDVAKRVQKSTTKQLDVVVNSGEEIRGYRTLFPASLTESVRNSFKRKFGLVEILAFGSPTVRLLLISTLPYVPYTYAEETFYTPSEISSKTLQQQQSLQNSYRIFGPIMLPVPFPNHNHGPKNEYVSAAMRQVAQYYPQQRLPFLSASHMWSLMYPQSIFVDSRRQSFPLYAVNVMACIMCLQGYNQEDAVVVNKSAADRGLFLTSRYGNYRVTADEGARTVVDVDPGCQLVPGTVIARITSLTPVKSYNTELCVTRSGSVFEVSWREDRLSPILQDIQVEEGGSVLHIIVRSLHRIAVGDKLMSNTGQKGVVAAILPEADLPVLHTPEFKGVSNLFLHPSFLKRQTASVFLEGVNRYSGTVYFPHLDSAFAHDKTGVLLSLGKKSFTGRAYCGKTGRPFADLASVYELSYQILSQHNAVEKCYATTQKSLQAREELTGQLRRGKSHFGAGGFSSMDVDALLGHGAVTTLGELMFARADEVIIHSSNKDPVRIGASMTRYLDDQRLMDLGMKVEILPKVMDQEAA